MNPTARSSGTKLAFDCQPLRAWRYNTQKVKASEVIAPPYDVISPEKQQKLYDRSPYNVVRLILNKKEPADTDTSNNYTRARDFFFEWQKSGILIQEKEPCFYVYRQTFKDPVSGEPKNRSALLARIRLEPFEKGIVIPHEKTLKGPREDRMKLIRMVQTSLSPVFGLYKDDNLRIRALTQDPMNLKPVFEAVDDDGIKHSLHAISDPDILSKIHEAFKPKKVYIADGHHRYETSLEYARLKHEELGIPAVQLMPFDYVYMALVSFDDPGFIVLPTHRIVSGFGMSDTEVLKRLQECFKTEKISQKELEALVLSDEQDPMVFGLLLKDEGLFRLTLTDENKARQKVAQEKPDVWYDLNVNMLGHLIFAKLLDLPESRWEAVLKFEHTVDGTLELMKKQNTQAAFFLQAPKVEMLEKMGAVSERMPQKSTYFYPKLASGLIFYSHKD